MQNAVYGCAIIYIVLYNPHAAIKIIAVNAVITPIHCLPERRSFKKNHVSITVADRKKDFSFAESYTMCQEGRC